MALVTNLKYVPLQATSNHKPVECTFDVVSEGSQKFLQLDTYGSIGRKLPGKKSQSIRLTPEAIRQLKRIIEENGW